MAQAPRTVIDGMPICSSCKAPRPHSAYARDKYRKLGIVNICKVCQSARGKERGWGKKKLPINCTLCGVIFMSSRKATKLCSPSCRAKYTWATREERSLHCESCGTIFLAVTYGTACSKRCRRNLADRKLSPQSCRHCGMQFNPTARSVIGVCGKKCAANFRAVNERYRYMKACEHCGAQFHPHRKSGRFCSRACAGKRPGLKKLDPALAKARHQMSLTSCHMIQRCLKLKNEKKLAQVSELLGYSSAELTDHLSSLFAVGMRWDNYGRNGWHVDHIRPISTFPMDTSISVICALSNLQPLWESENCRKGNRWEAGR